MSSIIRELQNLASEYTNPNVLLNKCVIVATKLHLSEFKTWTVREIEGWSEGTELPSYRRVGCILGFLVPGGWRQVNLQGLPSEFARGVRTAWVRQCVAEISALANGGDEPVYFAPPPPVDGQLNSLFNLPPNIQVAQIVHRAALGGVIQRVRALVLDWALKLEMNGITGEGMQFSEDEQARATRGTDLHIHNFWDGQIQLGTSHSAQYATR